MRCSPPHDFRHGGLHSHMPGDVDYIEAWRGVQEKTKFDDLVGSLMDNNRRRIKLYNTVVQQVFKGSTLSFNILQTRCSRGCYTNAFVIHSIIQ